MTLQKHYINCISGSVKHLKNEFNTLEQKCPAALARTTMPITICPKEVQKSIGLTIFNGDNIPGASIFHWDDELPYIIPIDIVKAWQANNDEYCSFDNRRLYAARNHAPPEINIVVRCHDFVEILPETRRAMIPAKMVL